MIFAENKQLFGFDTTEGIVAVEFFAPNQVQIFTRETDGSTSLRSEEFAPFLWNSSGGTPLEGSLALGKLITFPDWRSYQEARARFAKEGTPFFAFNDPVQQYLTSSGRTLFKGMRFEDLRRLQIDIQTAISPGFEFSSPERDAVIAVALSDSSGWEEIFVVEEGICGIRARRTRGPHLNHPNTRSRCDRRTQSLQSVFALPAGARKET